MLTHKNVSTTQIYADLIDENKRQAAEMIKIKSKNNSQVNVKTTPIYAKVVDEKKEKAAHISF
jgi:hypothetical protein